MGHFMARNLIKKGHELTVFDLNKTVVEDLKKAGTVLMPNSHKYIYKYVFFSIIILLLGAKALSSPADIASSTKCIITMLPSHPHVKEVYTNEKNGILL
jgi:3-hydroxyisobutyrate dehydrogenase